MKLHIQTAQPYSVTIANGLLDQMGELALETQKPGSRAMLISETNVYPLYGERGKALPGAGGLFCFCLCVPRRGSRPSRSALCARCTGLWRENDFTRTDFIVTLGGRRHRGHGGALPPPPICGEFPFCRFPPRCFPRWTPAWEERPAWTCPFGKNLVGAFHQPAAVLMDPETLKTLPDHFFRDGMGEVIKYGCISDRPLFEALEAGSALKDLEGLLARCVDSKRSFVEEDTRGHRPADDFEFRPHFWPRSGKAPRLSGAVPTERLWESAWCWLAGWESAWALPLPARRGGSAGCWSGMVLPIQDRFSWEEIVKATALDKKSDGSTLRLILLTQIGESVIYPITRDQLRPLL